MYKIFKKSIFLGLALTFFLAMSSSTFAARFFLAPATSELFSNCESAINIMIDTEGASSSAGDVIINFNPAEIDIIDQNASVPGVQVRPGTIYEFYPGNKVESGRIYLTGASIMSEYRTGSSPDIYGSIILKNKPGVANASLSFYYIPNSTVDSNISNPSGDVDLLSSVAGGTYTFVDRGYCGNDTIAPIVSNVVPVPNSQGNLLNSKITYDISDNLSGVNLSTVRVNIDGVDYVPGGTGFSSTGDKMKYSIEIDPLTDFLADTQVVVTVFAQDNAGNVMSPYRFSFNQPILDIAPPYVTNRVPAPGASGVDLDSSVSFRVNDDLSGVDIATILVEINGQKYKNGDGEILITGSVNNYQVTIQPREAFLPNIKVDVKIDASDLRVNKMTTVSYSFNNPIVDNQTPYVQNEIPKNGARLVPLNSEISFSILDALSGVDLASVKVVVDGIDYLEPDFKSVSGTKNNYLIEIVPKNEFEEGKEITASVDAKDIYGNEMKTFVFKFNRPAVCGDNVVESEFGEECEPPNSPGCGEFCKFEACTIPEVPFCGNMIVETGEECEPPGVGFCSESCSWVSEIIESEPVETFDPVESFNLYGGFLGMNNDDLKSMREMLLDSDGDGLPDVFEKLIGTNPNSKDSDGDGVDDLEELLDYGTDPTVFDAEFPLVLKIVSPENKTKIGASRLFVRGISEANRKVTVFARSLTGQNFELGTIVSSENGRFALASEVDLEAGEYLLTAENYEDDGGVFETSDTVEVNIDLENILSSPKVRAINDIMIKPGEIPQIDDVQPMVSGSTEAGSQVVSVFQSSIFSSTIISDANSGFFTVFAPRPLDLGMHKVTVYAVSPDGIVSEANVINFEVVESVSVFEAISWWMWILMTVLPILGLSSLVFWYKKRQKDQEIDYMKKLVAPVFEKKVEEQIKNELGEKTGKKDVSDDLFRRG